ncbi:MAG: hypothetical protein M1839_002014 [Geoglossum umbratile]|nr:MAG: hypothetical protein M1839_002014 [Geoglossum umbratile]
MMENQEAAKQEIEVVLLRSAVAEKEMEMRQALEEQKRRIFNITVLHTAADDKVEKLIAELSVLHLDQEALKEEIAILKTQNTSSLEKQRDAKSAHELALAKLVENFEISSRN